MKLKVLKPVLWLEKFDAIINFYKNILGFIASILMCSLLLMLNSCKVNKNGLKSLEEISIASLRKSNKAIADLSEKNYASLESKRRETLYGERVELWNNKAAKLKVFTSNLIHQVEF